MDFEQPPEPKSTAENQESMGRRICAWCGKDMGPAETKGNTHGICEECKVEADRELELLATKKEKN